MKSYVELYMIRNCFLKLTGPLVKEVDGKATVVGIVSWVKNRDCRGTNVFANVAKFTDWLQERMKMELS